MNDSTPSHPVRAERPRVALFVDGENLSSASAGKVVLQAAALGELMLRRVYGDVTRLNGWQSASGFKVVHAGTGKNATDLLLCVEVMHVALNRLADVVVIAASDRDYSHLATYLREASIAVYGLGEAKAPEALRKAFCKFHVVGAAPPRPAAAPLSNAVSGPPTPSEVRHRVLAMIKGAGKEGLAIHDINPVMHRAGFRISEQEEKTWRKWLEAQDTLFVCDPRGPNARVRLRQPV